MMDRRSAGRAARAISPARGVGPRRRLDYGAQSFFFQEEDGPRYESARYAMLRVAEDGGTVLTDLAGEDRAAIKPSAD